MDRKSKILFGIVIAAVLVSMGLTYYRSMITHDFYTFESETEEEATEEIEMKVAGESPRDAVEAPEDAASVQ
jgi:hypothetical protein